MSDLVIERSTTIHSDGYQYKVSERFDGAVDALICLDYQEVGEKGTAKYIVMCADEARAIANQILHMLDFDPEGIE